MLRNLIVLLLFFSIVNAQDYIEENQKDNRDRLDIFQSKVSSSLKYISSKTDYFLSDYEIKNQNKTKKDINDFFLQNDYYDKSNNSYLVYTFGYSYGAFEKLSTIHNLKIKIDLPHTKKKLRLIIDGEYDEDIKSIKNGDNTALALEYVVPFLDTTFRGGFKGISNPFVRVRVGLENNLKFFIFEPVQYFEYSKKHKYKETTKLYFDKRVDDSSLFELLLQRSTQTEKIGTDLFAGLFYSIKYGTNKGVTYSLSTSAETKPDDNDNKIISHTIKATWRQTIFKKYIFVNISPFIKYHRKYNYYREPFLMVTFDMKF